MRVIGTAGHVDHGKSTLVQALTGSHPDRLKEEQAREMTIELGFAWMTLPGGEEVGIVDVPGHRDFIENMLAGIGGIDAVLFVIAADEGVMPQTREHLAILDILQVAGGVIALTKVDLIDDPEWLDLVELDVIKAVGGTVLESVPIVRVSARKGMGIPELIQAIELCLEKQPSRPDLGRPRLPVDRVFTMPGFGTIVTGTLIDGALHQGEELVVLPGELHGRIRGLQSHKQREETAQPGSRTAVNLSGVEVDQIARGDVLVQPGRYRPTSRLDAYLRLLPDASSSLRHSSEVKFFVGASEGVARLRLLDTEELQPGEEGWIQLELRRPVVTVRGDRYILRRPSPGETLGGGTVVDPQPAQRHKRFNPLVLQQLESLRHGSPVDVLLQAGLALGAAPVRDVIFRARLGEGIAIPTLQELLDEGQFLQLEPGLLTSGADWLLAPRTWWAAGQQNALIEIQKYHAAFPLRKGILREELKSKLKLSARVFNALLRSWLEAATLVETGAYVALAQHRVKFNSQQQTLVERLMTRFSEAPYTPPSVKECQAGVGEDVFEALTDLEQLKMVSAEVVFRQQDYAIMVDAVLQHFEKEDTLTAAQFRDRFNTSRKYALAFLEYLDAQGVTLREGDFRKLRKKKVNG